MSYINIFTNSGAPGSDLGIGSSKNMSKVTIFGFTVLFIYSTTKILNFYGIGVDKYGPYLMFYVFLLLCVNVFNAEHPKM